jgi:TRAP-type mannitol/chloroaromatic compound transport system substrate-binding protein
LSDVEGLKIRFAGLGGKVIERLGASVTMLPGGEIFQALEKGAIDATEFSLPNVDEALGFDRIAKINYYPGWHQTYTAAHLVVNAAVWQGLNDAERAVIDTACTAGVTRNLANSEASQGPILAGFPAKGVTAVRLPEPILRELNKVTDEVMAEEARNDEDFRVIHESQLAFRAQYAEWKRLAYLPRDF